MQEHFRSCSVKVHPKFGNAGTFSFCSLSTIHRLGNFSDYVWNHGRAHNGKAWFRREGMECGEDVGGDQGLAVACGVAVRGGRGTKTDDETRVPVVVDDEQPKGGLGVLGKFRPRCRCLGSREKTEIRKQ